MGCISATYEAICQSSSHEVDTAKKNQMTTVTLTFGLFYSERLQGAGFRSVNAAERWRENPVRALARAGFMQHLECGIHRSESSPEGLSL